MVPLQTIDTVPHVQTLLIMRHHRAPTQRLRISAEPYHRALSATTLLTAQSGVTKTYVDKLASTTAMSGRQEAIHRFLKLTQPIRPDELPQPRVLEAGRTYEFPFHFGIPEQLLPKACTHKIVHDGVRDAHLQVPPSFGDPELSGYGGVLLDDMAPLMAKIVYSVRVQMFKFRPEEDAHTLIVESSKKLRVKPAFEEQPPLDLDIYGKHEDYCLRQEKTIRKGMLKGKLGRLAMESTQPKGFRLPAVPLGEQIPEVSTMSKVVLRFDPASEDCPPPRLGSMGSKLKVSTYYASGPRTGYPSRANLAFDTSQGYISEFVSLSSMCVASAGWRRHESWESPISRRDSALSTMSTATTATMNSNHVSSTAILEPTRSYKGKSFYTATVLVPLNLPRHKHLVPTFHTCLVSRVYGVHLSLGVNGGMGPSMTLKLPVQISSEGSVASAARRRQSMYVDQAIFDADAAFEPRNMGPPPDAFLGQSQLPGGAANEPPAYAFETFPSNMMRGRVNTIAAF